MLCWRRISAIGTPASPCFRISTIWLSVNRDFRMASPWPRKVYDQNVYRKGKLTAGLTCTIAGIVAMITPKRGGRHPSAGTVYYWGLVVVFLSMAALSILRWPANNHL